jgi:competence protein ComEA
MTIYIPSQGEVVSPTVLGVQHGLLNQSNVELGADWQVSSNTASAKQLESLPHVGPAAAEKIINARPFGSLEELVQKKALSQKTFDKIKDKLML